MASFTEKIKLLFEVDDKGSLGKLRRDIASADTASGKLKAGASGLKDMLKQNLATAATAAGSALVAFGVKSVAAFQDAALEAGKFADATGVTVEQSSRLIEVAGDVGVEVTAIQGALQKFNKAVADGKLDKFSDSLVRAKDGSVDAYESFINTATAIGKIQDPTERAQAAQQAFGKSYGEISELMQMDAEDLRAALDDVSDAKVIDEGELRRAKEFRAMLDSLKDRLEDVQLTVGERLVPRLVMMGKAVDKIGSALDKIPDGGLLFGMDSEAERKALIAVGLYDDVGLAIGEVIDKAEDLSEPLQQVGEDLADQDKAATSAANAHRDLTDKLTATSTAFHGMSKEAWDTVDATREAADETRKLADEQEKAEKAANDLKDAYAKLMGKFDERDAYRNATDALGELLTLIDSGDATWDQLSEATDNATKAYADFVVASQTIPAETKTSLLVALDQGKLDAVRAFLDAVAKGFDMPIYPKLVGGTGVSAATGGQLPSLPKFDDGGVMPGPRGQHSLALVAGGETVVPTHKPGVGVGGTTNNYFYIKADPNGSVQALKQFERINGTRWRR